MSEQNQSADGARSTPTTPPSGLPDFQAIYRDGQVDFLGLMFCIAGTVLLTKITSLLAPFNLYFTFSQLVTSGEGGYGVLPFLVKMAIPFAVGVCYFLRYRQRDGRANASKSTAHSTINLELTAATGAALGAALLSWPAIVLWEFVVSEPVLNFRVQFILVYILYIISFAYIACTGVMVARLMSAKDASMSDVQQKLNRQYQYMVIVRSLVTALATGGVADWASRHLSNG
jgi:hypothetical protein